MWKDTASRNTVGPGHYYTRGTFANDKNQGPSFGGKFKKEISTTPGPGAYDSTGDIISAVKSSSNNLTKGSVKMGKSKRPDHFVKKGSEGLPGPGSVLGPSYSSFDLKKGVTIEGKRRDVN